MVMSVTMEGPCDRVQQVALAASVRAQLLSPAMGSVPQMVAKGDVKPADEATCKAVQVGVMSCRIAAGRQALQSAELLPACLHLGCMSAFFGAAVCLSLCCALLVLPRLSVLYTDILTVGRSCYTPPAVLHTPLPGGRPG